MNEQAETAAPATENPNGKDRRQFLMYISLGIFGGMLATVAAAALRFLRPAAAQEASAGIWSNVAPLAEIKGQKPVMRSILVERQEGWATSLEEHFVYVLPAQNNSVLSSVCPHEGCNVNWQEESNRFSCPCHDSFFAPDGARLTGPARRGLDPLPSREENGILQVRFQTFENNTAERLVRG
ncbi:MAG TPA: ubiquinol-cytochrome c reductase iron-sulfur subunit [Pyrinomonadaceae bacterium]|jgi:menaquinol-cytochrome c reductase iron-sulfur subunit